MSKAKIVQRNLPDFLGEAVLVEFEEMHFAVSSNVVPITGFETLVFPARRNGEVKSWLDVAGGRGVSQEEAIVELEKTPVGVLQAAHERRNFDVEMSADQVDSILRALERLEEQDA